MPEAFGIACHELVSLDFRFGSTSDLPSLAQNVSCWGISRRTGDMALISESSQEATLRCRWWEPSTASNFDQPVDGLAER